MNGHSNNGSWLSINVFHSWEKWFHIRKLGHLHTAANTFYIFLCYHWLLFSNLYNSHEVNSPEIIMLAHQTNNQERVQSIKIQNYK